MDFCILILKSSYLTEFAFVLKSYSCSLSWYYPQKRRPNTQCFKIYAFIKKLGFIVFRNVSDNISLQFSDASRNNPTGLFMDLKLGMGLNRSYYIFIGFQFSKSHSCLNSIFHEREDHVITSTS